LLLVAGCNFSFLDGVFNACGAELPADLRDHPIALTSRRG
jgi:hypothetical protein